MGAKLTMCVEITIIQQAYGYVIYFLTRYIYRIRCQQTDLITVLLLHSLACGISFWTAFSILYILHHYVRVDIAVYIRFCIHGIKMAENFPFIRMRHAYKGVMYPNFVLDSSIDMLRTLTVRPDDIWLLSFPKAGTHWVMEIVGLILSNGDPDKINRSLYSSTVEMINMDQPFPVTREEEKLHPVDMTPFLDTVERAPSPRVMLDHLTLDLLPEDILQSKVVYVARNPKDSVLSWFEFVKDDPVYSLTMDKAIEEFMNYTMNWGSCPDHVRQFWKLRDHENMTFVFYEDLKKQKENIFPMIISGKEPLKSIQKIASGIGHPISEEILQRVVELSHIDAQRERYQKMAESGQENLVGNAGQYTFLNKGKIGRWKNLFTVAQNEAFDEWYKSKMGDADIKFTYE